MRIDCPSCAAAYEVPAAILTARRRMRCASCGAEFMPDDDASAPPAAPDAARGAGAVPAPAGLPPAARAADLPEAVVRPDDRMGLSVLPQPRAAAPRHAGVVLGAWALSFALLGAGAWAALAWRGPIMRAWPPSARLYLALGYTR